MQLRTQPVGGSRIARTLYVRKCGSIAIRLVRCKVQQSTSNVSPFGPVQSSVDPRVSQG